MPLADCWLDVCHDLIVFEMKSRCIYLLFTVGRCFDPRPSLFGPLHALEAYVCWFVLLMLFSTAMATALTHFRPNSSI